MRPAIALAVLSLVVACGDPRLHDVTVDASFSCPDGASCASSPDGGGCDPQNWQTSCGPGLVCASDGTCGIACGNGDVVCDPRTACDSTSDCVPQCLDPAGNVIVPRPLRAGASCLGSGYLEAANPPPACIVPCFYALCDLAYGGSCDPSIPMSAETMADLIRTRRNPFVHHLTPAATLERQALLPR
jgi:hypothetical protein